VNARVMPDRYFCDRESMHERERGKEPVHAFKEPQSLQHGPPEYFERASCVMDAVVGKEVSHTIGDPGRHFFHQAILPLLSPSAHKIVGISIGKEFQDVLAVLLKIAVDLDDDFSGRLAEACFERAGFSVISVEVEHPNLGVLRRQTIQCVATAVAAAIVHEDDFERPSLRGRVGTHDAQQPLDQGDKIVSFVLDGNDDGSPWIGWHGHAGSIILMQKGADTLT